MIYGWWFYTGHVTKDVTLEKLAGSLLTHLNNTLQKLNPTKINLH